MNISQGRSGGLSLATSALKAGLLVGGGITSPASPGNFSYVVIYPPPGGSVSALITRLFVRPLSAMDVLVLIQSTNPGGSAFRVSQCTSPNGLALTTGVYGAAAAGFGNSSYSMPSLPTTGELIDGPSFLISPAYYLLVVGQTVNVGLTVQFQLIESQYL